MMPIRSALPAVFAIAMLLLLQSGRATLQAEASATGAHVTRAQAVTSLLLTRFAQLPPYDARKQFTDLSVGTGFEAPMRAAEQYGIIQADAERRLRPQQPISRAEFLKMLARAFGLRESLPFRYSDVPPDVWYARYAGIAERYGLFEDNADSFRLFPNALLTQREASVTLQSILRQQKSDRTDTAEDDDRTQRQEEQRLAQEQARGKLQMYLVISTRRLRVRSLEPPQAEAPPHPPPRTLERQKSLHELRAELLTLVNRLRTQHGTRPLKYNTLLERSAQAYAEDMAQHGYFSHVSPDGETLKDRIQKNGYRDRSFAEDCFCVKGYALAENLARGQRTAEEAITAWMKSPSHREAILSPEYKDIGFGMTAGYWVQHFGSVLLPTDMIVKSAEGTVHAAP